jgi:hypothetical protein
MTEYGIMLGLVVGGIIGMQYYVKQRLQGAIQVQADDFASVVGAGAFEPDRTIDSTSTSATSASMSGVRTGTSTLTSSGTSTQTQTK